MHGSAGRASVGSVAAMADVQPLRALHYDPAVVGSLQAVVAPPYDVIDPEQRAELAGALALQRRRDRPARAGERGGDPYAHAAALLERWQAEGAVVRDDEPAIWALAQDYTGPDGAAAHPPRASSPASASRTTARAGSARTSARTRARRRTACG